MKIILIVLAALVFGSCVGQRGLFTKQASSFDCEVLVKKQQSEYRRALREGNAKHRRKTTVAYKTPARQKESETLKAVDNLSRVYAEPDNTRKLGIAHTPSPMALLHPHETYRKMVDVQSPKFISSPAPNSTSNFVQSKIEHSAYRPNAAAWLTLTGGGLLTMCLLGAFQNSARRLSRWGKNNPSKARAIIGAAHLVTGSGCLALGAHIYDLGVIVPEYVRLTSAGLFTSAVIFYPNKYLENGICGFSYLERKIYDVGLFTVGAVMMMYAGNHYEITLRPTYPVQAASFTYASSQSVATVSIAQTNIGLAKREFKQRIQQKVDKIKRDRTSGGKTVATILVVLGFIALTFGVAALSCTIACAGSEPAAIAVFIAGSALIVVGLVKSIRAIHKTPKEPIVSQDHSKT